MTNLFLYLLLSILVFGGCDSSNTFDPELLIGNWRSTDILINKDPTILGEASDGLVYLGLSEEYRYFMNYEGGQWRIEGDKLILGNQTYIFRSYTILKADGETLILKSWRTEMDYFRDFPDFSNTDIFEAVEVYIKH